MLFCHSPGGGCVLHMVNMDNMQINTGATSPTSLEISNMQCCLTEIENGYYSALLSAINPKIQSINQIFV